MSIYGKPDIVNALESGDLLIDPNPEVEMFSTSAVDLRLANRFSVFSKPTPGASILVVVDEADPEEIVERYGTEKELAAGEYLDLNPGGFVLSSTVERIEMPLHLAARVEGRSSLARFGLSVHQTAPTVHADFRGAIRLEIANVGPFVCRLAPGIRICQLIIEELKTPATEGLLSRFQDQAN